MKYATIKGIFGLLIMLYMHNATAGSALYSAIVTAEKAGVVDQTNITAPSFHACEIRKSDVISDYIASGFTILNASSCVPVLVRLPELIIPEWKPRWPVPPVCLSCPPWDLSILEILDPYLAEQVKELSQKYRVNEYMKALRNLQSEFDLEGFDKALEELDAQQQYK
ncbi:hypothetical protein [Nitrosomonas marina]|uniref:Uncharacterized protein n=1 Tax=Nitrosomonas marina TaxID=917 RepID=A0A1H8CRB1_9PROT|nr:hypothetical protein [Nitrosomonas marina]SEM97550.1 hypothetical protein SAMN05216325_105100 [Nitrosomonas marina]